MQVEELAARMDHAADFCDALFEADLAAAEVIADQLAFQAPRNLRACSPVKFFGGEFDLRPAMGVGQ